MRILAVDPGSSRIGLALSDEDGRIALPLRTVHRSGLDQAVRDVVEEATAAGVERIIVGLPLSMDGTEGSAARRARAFAAHIEALARVPVVMWDERLTTVAAERSLDEAGVRGPRRRAIIDQAAAMILLQSYLDAMPRASAED